MHGSCSPTPPPKHPNHAALQFLDGDDHRLRAPNGRVAARDCVQFVPFRPQQRDSVEGLAAKLLAELPGQVVEYFHDIKRMPPPPKQAPTGAPPAPGAQAGGPYPPAHAASASPPAVAAPGAYPQPAVAAPQSAGVAQPFPTAYPTI